MTKIALIVGVGSGNSAAFARALAAENYKVVLAARNIVLHICGESKWRVLSDACAELESINNQDDSSVTSIDRKYPILSVLRRSNLHHEGGVPASIYFAHNS